MSLTHPYLKQLKPHIAAFVDCETSVVDSHISLLPFCKTVEEVLQNGLKWSGSRHFYHWAESLADSNLKGGVTFTLRFCMNAVRDNKRVVCSTGKGRLLVRLLLNKGILADTLRLLKHTPDLCSAFYDHCSILGDEILSELFISLLEPLINCKFDLDIKNALFLDETWELATYRRYEMVPCKTLGVRIQNVDGLLIVTDVLPGSVADEDAKIEQGDVIDELFNECMRDASRRKLVRLMVDYEGMPVYVAILKFCDFRNRIFQPLVPYVRKTGLQPNAVLSNHVTRKAEMDQDGDVTPSASGTYRARLLGATSVGSVGTVERIEKAVVDVLKECKPEEVRGVTISMRETDVLVSCVVNQKAILQHGFAEISSCGRRIDYPLNFAYIAGETTCSLANHFVCYVFEASCDEQAKVILQNIAHGFQRTHWAV